MWRLLFAGSLAAGASAVTGCGSSSCEDTATCGNGTSKGGSSGASGTGGSGGASGEAGQGGSGTSGGAGGNGGEAGGDAGASGQAGAGGGGPGPGACDPTAPEEGCDLSDADGIFVAPVGTDTATGSKSDPVRTIGEAIDRAATSGGSIYVCNDTFNERLAVAADGLVIRGGYDCPASAGAPGWIYRAGERARVQPNARGYALRVESVTGLQATDLELVAANATLPGESSVAVFVTNSNDVSFSRTRMAAGNGVAGADGAPAGSNHFAMNLDGNEAMGLVGGMPRPCACPDGTLSAGALGGGGGITPGAGSHGLPDYGMGGGKGGLTCSAGGGNGVEGDDAPARTDGAGAATLGLLNSSDGWLSGAGANGLNGQPGQGGGGGAGAATGGGGGGACGGCGGKGGSGGKGGGASIALLALDSMVTLDVSRLETSLAGAGGNGTSAQVGQDGGARGVGGGTACNGGNGGKGAPGAAGGGGAGGVSVGILSKGGAITLSSPTFVIGDPGAAGTGGGATNDGVAGVAEEQLAL